MGLPPYLRRFDARTGRPLGRGVRIGRGAAGAAPTVPSDVTACSSPGADGTYVVDAATLRVRRRIPVGAFSRRACLRDGRSAALGGEDGSVAILDLRTGKRRTLAGRHEDRVRAAGVQRRWTHACDHGDDGRVLVWDLRSGEVRETLTGHTGAVNHLKVSDDGRTLYTAGLDGRIIVWDIAGDRRLARPFRGGRSDSGKVSCRRSRSARPAGRFAAGPPRRRRAPARRAHAAPARATCRGSRTDAVLAVEFSPDGRSIAVTGEAGTVELRDASSGRRGRRSRIRSPRRWRPRRAARRRSAFSPGRRPPRRCGSRGQPAAAGPEQRPGARRAAAPAGFALTCRSAPMAGCSRSGSPNEAPSCATAGRSGSSPACATRRRGRLLGSLLAGRPAAGRHLLRATRSCGTWRAAGESARR